MCASWQFAQLTPQYSHKFKLQLEHSDRIIDSLSQLIQQILSLLPALPSIKIAFPSPSKRIILNLSFSLLNCWLLLELFLAPSKSRPIVLSDETHNLVCVLLKILFERLVTENVFHVIFVQRVHHSLVHETFWLGAKIDIGWAITFPIDGHFIWDLIEWPALKNTFNGRKRILNRTLKFYGLLVNWIFVFVYGNVNIHTKHTHTHFYIETHHRIWAAIPQSCTRMKVFLIFQFKFQWISFTSSELFS